MENGTISGMVPSLDCVRLFLLAVLLVAFSVLFPYLDVTGSCGDSGCPQISQAHGPAAAELAAGAVVAVLAAVSAALASVVSIGCRAASDRRPAQIYLSPEPDPPRL